MKILFFIILLTQNLIFAETIEIKGGSFQYVLVDGAKRMVIRGNSLSQAYVVMETKTVRGDVIEVWGEDNRFLKATGNTEVVDLDQDLLITGEEFNYDRQTEIVKMKRNVYMEDRKNDVVIRCEYLEDFGNDKISNIQQNVRIFKDDMTARSEFAIYYREKEDLELFGFPIVYKKNDRYESTKIIVNVKTEDVTLQGEVRGTIENADKKEPKIDETEEVKE